MSILLVDKLEFSYSQFSVYDSLSEIGFDWSDVHCDQGFARSDKAVSFGTSPEFGSAIIHLYDQVPELVDMYQTVIAVPITCSSGWLTIEGPEEAAIVNRRIKVLAGSYALTVAQLEIRQYALAIDIWLNQVDRPLLRSEILVNKGILNPPNVLVETADFAYRKP